MKELSLLMFCIACGYVAVSFCDNFSKTAKRQRIFYIPSQREFNIIWGFTFYFGFAALTFQQFWLRFAFSAAILALFAAAAYLRAFKNNLLNPRSPYFNRVITRRLQKQQISDRKLGKDYSRREALNLLGLSPATEDDSPLPRQKIAVLQNLGTSLPNAPYLKELTERLARALSSK